MLTSQQLGKLHIFCWAAFKKVLGDFLDPILGIGFKKMCFRRLKRNMGRFKKKMRRMKRKIQQRETESMNEERKEGRKDPPKLPFLFHSRDQASFALKLQNPCTLLKPPSKPKICFCQMIHTVAPYYSARDGCSHWLGRPPGAGLEPWSRCWLWWSTDLILMAELTRQDHFGSGEKSGSPHWIAGGKCFDKEKRGSAFQDLTKKLTWFLIKESFVKKLPLQGLFK